MDESDLFRESKDITRARYFERCSLSNGASVCNEFINLTDGVRFFYFE